MSNSKITANDLRFAGEEADAIRGEAAFLVVADRGKPHAVAESELGGRAPLLELFTEPRGEGMQADVKAQLVVNGKPYTKEIPHFDQADSVFLTQSAVAKFILPYYMRFKTGNQVGALENSLFNPKEVIAAFHIPGSLMFAVSPKVGIVTLNPVSGDCECHLLPVDEGDDPSLAKTASTKSSRSKTRSPANSRSKAASAAKRARKRRVRR
jgi:hypothetical protein